jgi:serine/threonine-protein kinase RsbT
MMERTYSIIIQNERNIADARVLARTVGKDIGFEIVDQARIIVATSELARNIYKYAGNGQITITLIKMKEKAGIQILAIDHGPGMDLNDVMVDGFSTSSGLGIGLPGVKRLMDEFKADSSSDEGTKICVTKWL